MNHLHIYNSIIKKTKLENRIRLRKNQENYIYYENHHIIPRCLNGTDNKENLVLLTAREHFICHKLLTYIYPGNYKIYHAFHFMTFMNKRKYGLTSRDYKHAIELFRLIPRDHHGEKNPMFGKGYLLIGEKNGRFGKPASIKQLDACRKPKSKESKEKNRQSQLGKQTGEKNGMYKTSAYNIHVDKYGKDEADRLKIITSKKLSVVWKGKPKSEETKQKIKTSALNRKKYKCEHCNKFFDAGNLKQHLRKLEKIIFSS
jgi:5-methylcytosine-specific restriction endonuclease McrA